MRLRIIVAFFLMVVIATVVEILFGLVMLSPTKGVPSADYLGVLVVKHVAMAGLAGVISGILFLGIAGYNSRMFALFYAAGLFSSVSIAAFVFCCKDFLTWIFLAIAYCGCFLFPFLIVYIVGTLRGSEMSS